VKWDRCLKRLEVFVVIRLPEHPVKMRSALDMYLFVFHARSFTKQARYFITLVCNSCYAHMSILACLQIPCVGLSGLWTVIPRGHFVNAAYSEHSLRLA
jgi:hypothetical protein